jgi:adenylate kinase family enzyme
VARRVAIVGNAGSGKTYLAREIGARLGLSAVELDGLFWMPPGQYDTRRPVEDVMRIIEERRQESSWVVEGVFGELVLPFLDRADLLLWLDLPWDTCRSRLEARYRCTYGPSPDEAIEASFGRLVAYASGYWTRDDLRSHRGHQRIFDEFLGPKVRLVSEEDVNASLGAHSRFSW